MAEVSIPALQAGASRGCGQGARHHTFLQEAEATFAFEQIVVAHAHPARNHAKAHEAHAMAGLAKLALDRVQPQPQLFQLGFHRAPCLAEGLQVVGEEGHIIHVAQVGGDARQVGEMVVESIEVEIGEELAGEVADGQAAGALQRREQGVSGEGVVRGAGGGSVGQDLIEEPEAAGAGDALGELLAEDGEIDAGEVEADVGAEHPAMPGAFRHKAAQGLVAAVALAIGVAGGQKVLLKGRNDSGAEGVVHHPIAIGRSGNQTAFGITDFELAVGAGGVAEALKFLLELEEICFQMGVEGQHGGPVALAPLGVEGSGMEGGEAGDARPEIGEWCR